MNRKSKTKVATRGKRQGGGLRKNPRSQGAQLKTISKCQGAVLRTTPRFQRAELRTTPRCQEAELRTTLRCQRVELGTIPRCQGVELRTTPKCQGAELRTTPKSQGAVRMILRTTRPLQERDPQENRRNCCNGTFVKVPPKNKRTSSRRPRTSAKKGQSVPMVIYMPQVVAVAPMPLSLQKSQTVHHQIPVASLPNYTMDFEPTYQPYMHFQEQSLSLISSPNSSQEVEPRVQNDWPDDLQELISDWDNQGHFWEVVKWLSTRDSATPHMVANIRQMMDDWEESFERKCHQVLEWLGYGDLVLPPKVVVEAQPISPQPHNQWSSMIKEAGKQQL